jgi:hypothetical protein
MIRLEIITKPGSTASAQALALHILETFNDDGSIEAVIVLEPHTVTIELAEEPPLT